MTYEEISWFQGTILESAAANLPECVEGENLLQLSFDASYQDPKKYPWQVVISLDPGYSRSEAKARLAELAAGRNLKPDGRLCKTARNWYQVMTPCGFATYIHRFSNFALELDELSGEP